MNVRMQKKRCRQQNNRDGAPPAQAGRRRLIYVLPLLLILGILLMGASTAAIPDQITPDKAEQTGMRQEAVVSSVKAEGITDTVTGEYTAKLFGIFPAKKVESGLPSDLELVPCGDVFGVKFFTKGVVITSISEVESAEGILSPAGKAGLKAGDVLTAVDGREINTVEQLGEMVSASKGRELTVTFTRDGKSYKAKLTPAATLPDGVYKTGMWVRDSTAGIGTVTFYNPEDGSFGGLGHGIYDADTEVLLPLLKGAVVDIKLNDILRGRDGHPGELKGDFGSEKTGTLLKNSPCGVFGILNRSPECIYDPIPVASRSEVKPGKATILSNVDGKGVKEYDIEIVKIYTGNEETKNFVIEVCDPALTELTGGIVRGMSGSPILQDGKLVGAVTHVLVSDSARGYGIFIENMLRHLPEDMTEAA